MPRKTKSTRVTVAKRHAQIENISIFGATARMGPLGLIMYAQSFLNAARILPAPVVPFDPVRPYLVCHSIELGLKAFLSLQGVAMIELADGSHGHNLVGILQRAEETNIKAIVALTEKHFVAICDASHYYAGKVFEYPAVGEALSGYPSMPPVDNLFEAANLLVESLYQKCLEA